jgi:hypothetical protein
MPQLLGFITAKAANCVERSQLAASARQIATLDHQLAIIFGRPAMMRGYGQCLAIIGLGEVIVLKFAIGEAEVGENVGMCAEAALRPVERDDRGFVAMLINQPNRFQIGVIAFRG